jgi:hypothetical protein
MARAGTPWARERALSAIAEKLSAKATRVTIEDWTLRSLGFDEMGCWRSRI